MDFDSAEVEIRDFFETAWAGATSISWPDMDFTVPDGQTWVTFNCQENEGSQVSMGSPGNNRFRHFGTVILQIFAVPGKAGNDARAKAQIALNAFQGAQTTNDIVFFDAFARQVGNDPNGYYQVNVTVSFYYDELT